MRVGSYEVEGEVGRGGMGVVYRARSPDGRAVAIKVLHRSGAEIVARFERERRLLDALGLEQGFVPLLEAGTTPAGLYLVMPFVAGGTLRQKLDRGPLGLDATLALGRALARALGAAHARGIVHRDMKPENVLFTEEGRPLIADLGLAKHFDTGASQSVELTRSHVFQGTVGYAPREQMRDAKSAGPPADVFALGAILHECLSGQPAFGGESALDALTQVEAGRFARLRSVVPAAPEWLCETIDRALARDPGKRFADGLAFEDALAPRGKPRRRRRLVLGVSAVVVLVAIGLVAVPEYRRAEARRAVARSIALFDAEDFARAAVEDDRALALDPGSALARAVHGELAAERGDAAGALADYERAIALDPTCARAWADRCLARGKGDLAGALRDAGRAIELAPGDAASWIARGRARETSGDLEGAIADATHAIELAPRSATAWNNRALARVKKGELEAAIQDYGRVIELAPRSDSGWGGRAWARTKTGDFTGAIADLDKALELHPATPRLLAARASARESAGQVSGAISDYERLILTAPQDPLVPEVRGRLEQLRVQAGESRELNGFPERIPEYTRAIERNPTDAAAWADRGSARVVLRDYDGAIDDFGRAIELAPKVPTNWIRRAAARGIVGEVDGVIADSTRAIELDPSLTTPYLNRATARFKKSDFEGALADCDRAIERNDTMAKAWLLRGTLLDRKNDRAGARSAFQRFVELAPDDPLAELARTRIREGR